MPFACLRLVPLLRCCAWLLCLAAVAAVAPLVHAHEVPSDVTVQIIVKPEADRVRVLVRAPLEAMQDVEFPTFGPGYLDLARADASLRSAAQIWLARDIAVFENGERLPNLEPVAIRVSIPSDRSFARWDTALAHLQGPPLAPVTQLVWQQGLLDVLFEAPIDSAASAFGVDARLERLGRRVTTAVQFVAANGAVRIYEAQGDAGLVELDPRWHRSLLRFLGEGFEHILGGVDHLLFLVCLVVPFRRELRALVWIVTAFTVGHSMTLLASAYGAAPDALWFPPLVETLIAGSILYMAIENAVAAGSSSRRMLHTRAVVAAGFGLIHGFGFSFALRNSLQFAGDHVLTALLAFNVGIELGQLLVLALLVPVLAVTFKYVIAERAGVIVLSAVIGHTAWHWMADRFAALGQFY
jgi:hydrogenase/urease accessory protein HupE